MHCVFCSFTSFLLVFFVFHRKDLVFLNLVISYMTSTSESFIESKNIVNLFKINVYISKLFLQCNAYSCGVHITGGVKIYLYIFVIYSSLCVLCVFVCVCNIKSEYPVCSSFWWKLSPISAIKKCLIAKIQPFYTYFIQ